MIKDTERKVFLILDYLRVHHSKPVKAWALANAQKMALFYLPSYSPELNPEERLNADLKHAITSKVPVRTTSPVDMARNSAWSNTRGGSPGTWMRNFRSVDE